MVVLYEFFSSQAIENVITCMHFKVDKVVFFEYYDVRRDKKENVKRFLKSYCGVQSVVFQPLPANDLQAVLKAMAKEIRYELDQGGRLYFDITGGESLILVAFGMLAREYETPMHIYDIEKDRLIELDSGFDAAISKDLEIQEVKLNLESFIGLQGGVINWRQHKGIKGGGDPEFLEDITKIWKIVGKYTDYWNLFTDFLRKNMVPDQDLSVDKPAGQVLHALYELETVASRFGGKYARKVLVTARDLGDVYLKRAAEMGVEVRPLFLSEEGRILPISVL